MFTHHQQNRVWSERLRSQAETLPSQEHGSGQQWLPGEHIFSEESFERDIKFDESLKSC